MRNLAQCTVHHVNLFMQGQISARSAQTTNTSRAGRRSARVEAVIEPPKRGRPPKIATLEVQSAKKRLGRPRKAVLLQKGMDLPTVLIRLDERLLRNFPDQATEKESRSPPERRSVNTER